MRPFTQSYCLLILQNQTSTSFHAFTIYLRYSLSCQPVPFTTQENGKRHKHREENHRETALPVPLWCCIQIPPLTRFPETGWPFPMIKSVRSFCTESLVFLQRPHSQFSHFLGGFALKGVTSSWCHQSTCWKLSSHLNSTALIPLASPWLFVLFHCICPWYWSLSNSYLFTVYYLLSLPFTGM